MSKYRDMQQLRRELERGIRDDDEAYERNRRLGYTYDQIDEADRDGRLDEFGNIRERCV